MALLTTHSFFPGGYYLAVRGGFRRVDAPCSGGRHLPGQVFGSFKYIGCSERVALQRASLSLFRQNIHDVAHPCQQMAGLGP